MAYGDEYRIPLANGYELRCSPYPEACDYVRFAVVLPSGREVEIAYWNSDEWGQDPHDAMGAIMGTIQSAMSGQEASVSAISERL